MVRAQSGEHLSTNRESEPRASATARPSRGAPAPKSGASRQAGKELTRKALLKAALKLLSQHSFDSISLREVTREAGVSPTAFYRHFDDMEELGLVLVEDALGTLRQMIRDVRLATEGPTLALSKSLEIIANYAQEQDAHLRFIARERYGGVKRLRRVIRREIQLFTDELAVDLGEYEGLDGWSIDDRRVLAGLVVESIVHMAVELLDARGEEKDAIVRQTTRQVRLAILGVPNWRPMTRR